MIHAQTQISSPTFSLAPPALPPPPDALVDRREGTLNWDWDHSEEKYLGRKGFKRSSCADLVLFLPRRQSIRRAGRKGRTTNEAEGGGGRETGHLRSQICIVPLSLLTATAPPSSLSAIA